MASGVEGFIKRDSRDDYGKSTAQPFAPAQPHQQGNTGSRDRSSARGVKLKLSKKATVNPQSLAQQPPSTAPAPLLGYESNSNRTGPNSYSHLQLRQLGIPTTSTYEIQSDIQFTSQKNSPIKGNAFEDTITSGFDDTRSDGRYNGDPRGQDNYDEGLVDDGEYKGRGEETQNEYFKHGPSYHSRSNGHHLTQPKQHVLQHQQSRSPLVDADPRQQSNALAAQPTPGISGRFAPAGGHWQQDMALQNSPSLGRQAQHSNHRSLSDEDDYESDDRATLKDRRNLVQERLEESEDEDMQRDESPVGLPRPQDSVNHHLGSELGQNGFEPRSEGVESDISSGGRRQARSETNKHTGATEEEQDRFKPSHTDEELRRMEYADLNKETWDDEKPAGAKRAKPTETQDTNFTMGGYIMDEVLRKEPEVQAKAFADMSMQEYEDAGDFLISKFAELMKGIRDARKQKRDVLAMFEEEIEAREKAVRGKSDIFEQKFTDMRAGGEGVLSGKI